MPAIGKGDRATHDIVLTIGGTPYGFMLWQDRNGKKSWKVYDSPTLIPQFTQNEPGYGNYPPEREIVKTQTDFRYGMGWEFYEDGRYGAASAVDTRWKDLLILGPQVNATALSGGGGLSVSGVGLFEFNDELWLATTSKIYWWDNTNAYWVEKKDFGAATITHVHPFNGFMYIALGSTTNYQVTADGTTYYASTHASSKAKFFSSLNRTLFKAVLPDEVKYSLTAYIDIKPTTVTIASIGAGGSVNVGDHKYQVVFYDGTNFSGASDDSAVATTTAGNQTVNLSAIPVHPAVPTGVTMQRVIFRNSIVDPTTFRWLTTIADNTTTTYADTTADSGLGAGLTQTNPWSAAAYVGDKETDITNLQNYRSSMYVGKEAGIYTVSTAGTVTPVLTDFMVIRSTLNFTKMAVFQDHLFFNIGKSAVYVFDGTNIEYIGWDLLAPQLGVGSHVGAFAPGYDFLYVIVKGLTSGATTLICSLRKEVFAGTSDWRWHDIAFLTLMDTPATALISPLQAANPRLWMAGNHVDSGVNKPHYLILPQIGSTPNNDSAYRFATGSPSGVIITGNFDMGFRADLKLFTALDILCDIPAGNSITAKYQIDDAISWTTMGTVITAGPKATRYVNATGRFIRFQLNFETDSNTESPKVYGIAVRGVLRAKRRKVFEFSVIVADDVLMLTGQPDKNPASLLATQLKNADDPTVQTGVVTLRDRDATAWNVVFEAMTEDEVLDEYQKRPVRVFHVRAIEANVA